MVVRSFSLLVLYAHKGSLNPLPLCEYATQ